MVKYFCISLKNSMFHSVFVVSKLHIYLNIYFKVKKNREKMLLIIIFFVFLHN